MVNMPKITLTYEFADQTEFDAFMAEEVADAEESTAGDATEPGEMTEPGRAAADVETRGEGVDADGMPFDAEVHSPTKTDKGLWRSKKGKSAAADAARAAFKAAGADVKPPVINAPTLPGMPGLARAVPEVVTYDALLEKTIGLMNRGVVKEGDVMGLYAKLGITDPMILTTNESMRRALFIELSAFEG
jgi:hypothetical protein